MLTKIKTASAKTKAVFVLLLVYLTVVLCYTVFMRPTGFFGAQFELFWSYRKWLAGDWKLGWQILGNITMFIPFGFLLSDLFTFRKKSCLAVVIAGFLLSCIIEFLQLELMRGLFEYDDIINNTLGALLGFLLYKRVMGKPAGQGRTEKVVIILGTVFVVTGFLLCLYNISNDSGESGIEKINIPREICFQIDKATFDGDRFILTGFAFGCEHELSGFCLTLKSTKTGNVIKPDVEYGLQRPDVAAYFNGEQDFTNSGFIAYTTGVHEDEEYEVFMYLKRFAAISTGVFISGTDIHYVKQRDFIAPEVRGTALEEIVNKGYLRVYRPDRSCYVYQYKGSLYWIADQAFNFEDDGTTYIQYQLWTTQTDKLPQKRLKKNLYWDNIGGFFEKNEITHLMNCGRYRVSKRKMPEEYSITSIVTGYYKNGKWIWRNYFRPVYEL